LAGDVENLKIQQQINSVLAQRAQLLDAAISKQTTQLELALELCKAMDCEDLEKSAERLQEIRDGMQGASRQADQMGGSFEQAASTATRSFSTLTKGVNATSGALTGAAFGIKNAFDGLLERGKAIGSFFASITSGIWSISSAILMAPFSMLSGLIGLANESGGGGGDPLREAYEKVRETWGSLASNEGKALKDSVIGLRKAARDFGGTGLKLSRIYGRGRAGLAAALEDLDSVAQALGNTFGLLKDEFTAHADDILSYKKGLGLTEDAMAALSKRALATGRALTGDDGILTEMASLAINMGDKFGISAKRISKDMQVMTEDFSNFGSMSQKELAATSVYAHKLGMEIEDMMGVIEKFDNFEDAATGAALLAQSFGMNIDAMEMMNAQSPAERIDLMRKSFFAAGQSLENMTRQERKLLETQTGLAGAALDAAFANESMGLSYDEVTAGAEDAEKKQLTQAEAMKELADSIERVFGGGGGKRFTSFWDAFSQGFKRGVMRSRTFRKLWRTIRRSLKETYKFGIRLGRMFVDIFPGIKSVAEGLTNIFNPAAFKQMFGQVEDAFRTFAGFLGKDGDPIAGVEQLLENLRTIFSNFFGGHGEAMETIKNGLQDAFLAAFGIIAGLLPVAVKKLTELFIGIAEWISSIGEKDDKASPKTAFELEMGKIFDDLWKTLEPLLPKLKDAFIKMFTNLWAKYGGEITDAILTGLAIVAGGALLSFGASALMGGGLGGMFDSFFGGSQKAAEKSAAKVGGAPDVKAAPMAEKGGFIDSMVDAAKALHEMTIGEAVEFGLKLTIISTSVMGALIEMGYAMKKVASMFSEISWDDLGKGLAAVVVAIGATVALVWAVRKMGDMDMTDIIVGLGAVALVLEKGVPMMIKAAEKIADSIPKMVKLMVPLGKHLKDFANGLPEKDVVKDAAQKMVDVAQIVGIMGALMVGGGAVGLLGGAAKGVADWIGIDFDLKIFDTVGEAMDAMRDALDKPIRALATWSVDWDGVKSALNGLTTLAVTLPQLVRIQPALDKLKGLKEQEIKNVLRAVGGAVESIVGWELGDTATLGPKLETMTKLSAAMPTLVKIKAAEKLADINPGLIAAGAANLELSGVSLGKSIRAIDRGWKKGMGKGLKHVAATLNEMNKMEGAFTKYVAGGSSNIIRGFNKLAEEMNKINDVLNTQMETKVVAKKIQAFGKAMKVGRGVINVKGPPKIQVAIEVNVSMDAKKIAKALANSNVIGTKDRLVNQKQLEKP